MWCFGKVYTCARMLTPNVHSHIHISIFLSDYWGRESLKIYWRETNDFKYLFLTNDFCANYSRHFLPIFLVKSSLELSAVLTFEITWCNYLSSIFLTLKKNAAALAQWKWGMQPWEERRLLKSETLLGDNCLGLLKINIAGAEVF